MAVCDNGGRFRVLPRRINGWLAQLVRAPALHAGGHRFESCTAHHTVTNQARKPLAVAASLLVGNTVPTTCLSGLSVKAPEACLSDTSRVWRQGTIMAGNRDLRWEEIDKSKTDLSVLMQHFEVHNKMKWNSPRTLGWFNEVLGRFIKWQRGDGSSPGIGPIY